MAIPPESAPVATLPPGQFGSPSSRPPGPPVVPTRRGRSPGFLAGIVVVVAVVVGVLALALAGVIPLFHVGGSTNSGSPQSYAGSEVAANSLAGQTPGGPWTLYLAEGVDLTRAYSNTTPGAGCTLSGGTGSVSLPSYTGNYSSGTFAEWVYGYSNLAGTAELVIQVGNGHATEAGVVSGSGCPSFKTFLHPLPGNVEDSTQIAAKLLGVPGVGSFLHNYSSANASFELFNTGLGGSGALWSVSYTACGLAGFASAGAGPAHGGSELVTVNATTGTSVYSSYSPPSALCSGGGSTTPIGSAFAAGAPLLAQCPSGDTYARNGCQAGDFGYTLTVEQSTVTLGDVLFQVRTFSGAIDAVSGDGGFSIVNLTGGVVAQSTASPNLFMAQPWNAYVSAGPTTPLTALDSILIDVGTTNPASTGLQFFATGLGPYSGTTTPLSLP